MNVWLVTYRVACLVLVAAAVAGIVEIFLPKIRENEAKQKFVTTLAEENRRKEESTRELRERQDRFVTDPAYVERVARETLGKVRPDEVIFRFSDSETNTPASP